MMQRAADGPASGRAVRNERPGGLTTERDARFECLLADLLLSEPVVRRDLVDAARARLAEGTQPSALDLAGLLVDELVGALQH